VVKGGSFTPKCPISIMNATIAELPLPTVAILDVRHPRKRGPLVFVWEAVRIAADSIWAHKLRSFLTLLGIIIGVASVVTVGGAIEGLGYYVNERLVSTFGSNAFVLARIARINLTGEEWERLIKRNKEIRMADLRAIRERCVGCEAVAVTMRSTDDVKVGNETFYDANVHGVSVDIPKIQSLEVVEGRFFSTYEAERARPLAVLGSAIREQLFGTVGVLGKEIRIGGDSYLVIGVEKQNGSFFGQSMDNNVYIPYTAFLKKYGTRRSLDVRVKAPSIEVMEAVQDEVRVIMRTRHKLRPNEEDDFDILASEGIQKAVGQFTGAIAAVVTPITLISLVVGGIVVMNIMLVTVTERTKEIGLRKALGARRRDIMLQFLIESAMLASLGGTIGILVAYGLSLIIRGTTPIPMTITPGYILLALAASGGIGLISGIYPAHRAAKLDPIVALMRD
jgi:putative ABC transport system permease protein